MTITDFVARALSVANSRGLSTTNSVLLTVNEGSFYTWIIVSHVEPHSEVAPVNLVWVPADETLPEYGSAMRRTARVPQGQFQHSWSALADYAALTADEPFWDTPMPTDYELISHVADISNPHATEMAGTTEPTVDQPVIIRDEPVGGYLDEEAVPKSWVSTTIGTLISQVGSARQALSYLISQLSKLKARVDALELNKYPAGHNHEQVEAAKVWTLDHTLNTDEVLVAVYNDQNKVVYPSSIEVVDTATIQIAFAVPMTGEANVRPR